MAHAKLVFNHDKKEVDAVIFVKDDGQAIGIPFCPDNTDYQQFLRDVEAGAELLDAEGNVMNTEQISEFIETLL